MKTGNGSALEVVIVGGGPGGYAAAFHAADLGMKVTLLDADPKPGGVCLYRGCIPSKALLHVAKLLREAHEAEQWGVSFGSPRIDLDRLRGWKENVVGKLGSGVESLCKQRGVTFIHARARLLDAHTLALTAPHGSPLPPLSFEHLILATGSAPAIPGPFRIADPRIMDSTSALALPDVPQRLLVIGGGYIGLELGTVYAALGSAVTVVELTDGLLPGADRDLVRPLAKRLESQFAAIMLNTKVESLEPTAAGIVAKLSGEGGTSAPVFDRVLISVGRRPNTEGLGLENTRIERDQRGFIVVNKQMRTAEPGILAIGDIAGEPMLAHKASREGKVAVEVIAGLPAEFDNVAIPAVVFTDPEIAWCGLTETQAKASGRSVTVMRFPWSASGRALTLDRTEGSTKLLFDPETERILGVGIVGPGAGELISEGVLAIETAAVARDIADSIHPHPTLTETIGESAEAFLGHATHIYRPKK